MYILAIYTLAPRNFTLAPRDRGGSCSRWRWWRLPVASRSASKMVCQLVCKLVSFAVGAGG